MAVNKNLINAYDQACSTERIDLIMQNYAHFIDVVDGYTEQLLYVIECDRESLRHSDRGELGVRIQSGGMTSDPTARKAISNVLTRDAIMTCELLEDILDGLDRADEYIHRASVLRIMRKDYELFNRNLGFLGDDKTSFLSYITREKDKFVLAEEEGLSPETIKWRINKDRKVMKQQLSSILDGNLGGIA